MKTRSLCNASETAATLQRLTRAPRPGWAWIMPAALLLILTAANDDRNQEPPTMERHRRAIHREHDRQR